MRRRRFAENYVHITVIFSGIKKTGFKMEWLTYVNNPATYLGYPNAHKIGEVFCALLIFEKVFSILEVCLYLEFVVLDSLIVLLMPH